MKLKLVLSAIIIVLMVSAGAGQNNQNYIRDEFIKYINTIANRDFENSMSYIIDEFFNIIPKENMIKAMHEAFNNPELEIEISDIKIIEIKESELIENKYYSLLTYSNKMKMKFKQDTSNKESTEEYDSRMTLTKKSFEEAFGEKNVLFSKVTSFFEIHIEKQAYAISINGQTQWKFLVIEKNQKPLLEKLLPKKLIDKL